MNMNVKEITTGIIAVLIILAAVGSIFYPVNEAGARILQSLSTLIIGYYFGAKNYPLSSVLGKGSK